MRTPTFSYTSGFRRLLGYAAHDCAQRGESSVRVDHLVLGLFREDFPLIDDVLASFRVDSMVVLDRLLKANPARGEAVPPTEVVLAPEAMRAIAVGEREASVLGDRGLTSAHVFLGVLFYKRERLRDFFIRDELVNDAEEVLARVRELVRWLRPSDGTRRDRQFEVLDDGTWVAMDAVQVSGQPQGRARNTVAVKLRMLGPLGSA